MKIRLRPLTEAEIANRHYFIQLQFAPPDNPGYQAKPIPAVLEWKPDIKFGVHSPWEIVELDVEPK